MSRKDLVIFTRQFATMIDAGLPLVQCLDILADQTDNPTFKEILTNVKATSSRAVDLRRLAASTRRSSTSSTCNLVAAGEVGGILDTILKRLAVYIEKAEKLKRKVKGAMVYPIRSSSWPSVS